MRIPRELMWMDMCEVAARRATCYRANVGALIVDPAKRDIVSVGYNGPPPGEDHCHGKECVLTDTGGCLRARHAERNVILRASDKLRKAFLGDYHLYCTYSPCDACSLMISSYNIERLYFRYKYRDERPLLYLLENKNFQAFRVTPAGHVINIRTNQLVENDA